MIVGDIPVDRVAEYWHERKFENSCFQKTYVAIVLIGQLLFFLLLLVSSLLFYRRKGVIVLNFCVKA